MIRVRYLVFIFFLFFFIIIFGTIAYMVLVKDVMGIKQWEEFYSDSKVQDLKNYLSEADANLRDIIENIQMVCASKIVNTSDRILLNAIFIPLLIREKYIKSIQVVLPNKIEYAISSSDKGWKTAFQIWGEKGLLRKTAIWAEDGVQMLEEKVEEVPISETFTALEWYKKSTEISLTQAHKNRKGTPKVWVSRPILDENEKSFISQIGIAIGYDDAPFSAVSITFEWSWLQDTVDSLYREQNIEAYILCDELIICRVGLNYGNIDSKTSENYLSSVNLPEDVKDTWEKAKSLGGEHLINVRNEKILGTINCSFLFNFPLMCVFEFPILYSQPYKKWNAIFLIMTIGVIMIIFFTFMLSYLFEKPLEKTSHWLENPTEREFHPKEFLLYEYYTLINKFNHILKFLRPLCSNSLSVLDKENIIEQKKDNFVYAQHKESGNRDIFVFSESGIGGITLEVFENLQRENIRLQKQIEVLNIYYSTQLNLGEREKSKYLTYLTGIREAITLVNKPDLPIYDKVVKILGLLNSAINVDYSIILKVNPETKLSSTLASYPTLDLYTISYSDLLSIIGSLSQLEVMQVKLTPQNYYHSEPLRLVNAKSMIVASIERLGGDELILISVSSEERNWEYKEELFVALVSKILGMCEIMNSLDTTQCEEQNYDSGAGKFI
ncbi:MAG: hypothetical protein N3G21_03655 [Candidatus Hydrogenedentes bacterium]|nr:hypothetical protein [Candidatus Hydrogenedentota bacterium]